jgi:SagB-type dehydrogenase family enzyme
VPYTSTRLAVADEVPLPAPIHEQDTRSLVGALCRRRSVRRYSRQPLTLDEVARLSWAAQGLTGPAGLRTAPSAGALYPLEVFVVAGSVAGLVPGTYRYSPERHALALGSPGDARHALAAAALDQECVEQAPAVLALAAVCARTTRKYGERGVRYLLMEAGHAAQNVCLQAVALGLGAVVVGAFDDDAVQRALGAARQEVPVCLLPVGRPG